MCCWLTVVRVHYSKFTSLSVYFVWIVVDIFIIQGKYNKNGERIMDFLFSNL